MREHERARAGAAASVRRRALAAVSLVVIALFVGLLLSVGGDATAPRASSHRRNGLVGYPRYLPRRTLDYRTDGVVDGSAAQPALTSQGDTVRVEGPAWTVRATVSGPVVPGEGLTYQTPTTTCTWTIRLWGATAPVRLAVADFDTVDMEGAVYRLSLVPGEHPPPRWLAPGRAVSFQVRTIEAVGEGVMRWAPLDDRVVARWDFVVEND